MDNYSIKSVAFGGFDKQDVIHYIEKTAQEFADELKKLQEENAMLQEKLADAEKELEVLQKQAAEQAERSAALQETLAKESRERQNLEQLKPLEEEVTRLSAEKEALRPDAEAYAQFREKIGAIECEARKRAADLEDETIHQLQKTVDLFREQYQVLMSTFEATASHVNSELRKVEVNLTQLPRAMDQAGSELNELALRLKQSSGENHMD